MTVQFARGPRHKEPYAGPPDRQNPPRPRRTIYRMQITGLPPETSWQVSFFSFSFLRFDFPHWPSGYIHLDLTAARRSVLAGTRFLRSPSWIRTALESFPDGKKRNLGLHSHPAIVEANDRQLDIFSMIEFDGLAFLFPFHRRPPSGLYVSIF